VETISFIQSSLEEREREETFLLKLLKSRGAPAESNSAAA
jgi:vacuolar-type H+-ATPase subunit D/Vma8